MKYSTTFLLSLNRNYRLDNVTWQRIGFLGIGKKYRGKRSGNRKNRISVRIPPQNSRVHTLLNVWEDCWRSHNPFNCIKPKLTQSVGRPYDFPNVFVSNSRPVQGKVDKLQLINDQRKYEVICITEPWLNDQIPDEPVRLVHYNIVRWDRNGKKGGGMVVYAHESLSYQVRHDLHSDVFECQV